MKEPPLVSFCISTFKRPSLLSQQLARLSKQTYPYFNVIISDNDPNQGAREIVTHLNDKRFIYFANNENLGMIRSFNKSIERANTEYIVMITDDDPLETNFLKEMISLINIYPNKSMYCGFKRKSKSSKNIEIIDKETSAYEVLNPKKSLHIFWSNCILKKADVKQIGLIPDYGSPHLADHALLALTGSVNGIVIKNKIYSTHHLHEANFSKQNFNSYYEGCIGFYETLHKHFISHKNSYYINKIVSSHLKQWFISMSFSLRKYYYKLHDKNKLKEIDDFSQKILRLDFMKTSIYKYQMKRIVFEVKILLGVL